jgi:hypothetical protein
MPCCTIDGRVIDEGWRRTLPFLWNVARTPEARRRIRAMRSVFRAHSSHLAAIALVAVKPLREADEDPTRP